MVHQRQTARSDSPSAGRPPRPARTAGGGAGAVLAARRRAHAARLLVPGLRIVAVEPHARRAARKRPVLRSARPAALDPAAAAAAARAGQGRARGGPRGPPQQGIHIGAARRAPQPRWRGLERRQRRKGAGRRGGAVLGACAPSRRASSHRPSTTVFHQGMHVGGKRPQSICSQAQLHRRVCRPQYNSRWSWWPIGKAPSQPALTYDTPKHGPM